jgi:hypothetical protein
MTLSAPATIQNRSVPFIARSSRDRRDILLLDNFELVLEEVAGESKVQQKISDSLNLSFCGEVLRPDEFEMLIVEQYAAASEYVYGHSIWESVRNGARRPLLAYLFETRHYLAASASRMAPSIKQDIGLSPLALLLSQHLLEEWDHAKFFSEALRAIGCSPVLSSASRPLPATLEWIHATRSIAYKSDLGAALCSGFMEYSSKETQAVLSWHSMLVAHGLIPAAANNSILQHLETDISFDHSENWKRAIRLNGAVTASVAASALNDIVTIAEAIYRWLSALLDGCSASIVYGIESLTEEAHSDERGARESEYDCHVFDGLPVWPSAVMEFVSVGNDSDAEAAKIITAVTYALGHASPLLTDAALASTALASTVRDNARRLAAVQCRDLASAPCLETEVTGWLRCIDGHSLWDDMTQLSCEGLIVGYLLENFHYLASAARHIGAAIASCTNTSLRLQLIHHLEDELKHCDLLETKLAEMGEVQSPSLMRPLSTTVAFVGFLQNIARQDWKAYILVSAFLQKSLSECRASQRHSRFYELVIGQNPRCGKLLTSIWEHDDLDKDLGHDDRPSKLLATLVAEEPVSQETLRHAAVAPALAWSFLDGIRSHYRHGRGALFQRVGWHAC